MMQPLIFIIIISCVRCYYTVQYVAEHGGLSAVLVGNDESATAYNLLNLEIGKLADGGTHIRLGDLENQRWTVPSSIIKRNVDPSRVDPGVKVEIVNDPFHLKIIRNSDQEEIFNGHNLIFREQFMQLSTKVPENANIFGFGEWINRFKRDPKNSTFTIWARDSSDDNQNVYGHFPVHIELRNGVAHGIFLINSNGMDVILQNGEITYKVIGGVFEFVVFSGPTIHNVLHQYLQLVGKPTMMPYWSLGWHQCRWGYNSIEEVENVVENYKNNQLPLEAMWIDIDYMDQYKVFTFDSQRFPLEKVQSFKKKLEQNSQQMVLILDPGIKIEEGFHAYELGMNLDIFIKNPRNLDEHGNMKPFIGKVWPGRTHFPDWFNPKVQEWWTSLINGWFELVQLDGIWIDMNEVANFCEQGDCDVAPPSKNQIMNATLYTGIGKFVEKFNPHWPEYNIGNGGDGRHLPLHHRTAPMDGLHFGNNIEYFTHSLFGHMEAEKTFNSLKKLRPRYRPFILSRSTFPGSGRYTAHWLGDNKSTFKSMRQSISGVLNFNSIFGIPMVGADICGFFEATNEELCTRWTMLGSLIYTFARNHNEKQEISQEPYLFKSVIEVFKKYVHGVRYRLLPFYYTLMFMYRERYLPIIRSLAFEFGASNGIEEFNSMVDIDDQVLIGGKILVSPIVEEGATSRSMFVPAGVWYDYLSFKMEYNFETGRDVVVEVPLTSIPIHVLGGSVIPRFTDVENLMTTRDLVNSRKYEFLSALDITSLKELYNTDIQLASGYLYLDNDSGIIEGSSVLTEVNISLQDQGSSNFQIRIEMDVKWSCSVDEQGVGISFDCKNPSINENPIFITGFTLLGFSELKKSIIQNYSQTFQHRFTPLLSEITVMCDDTILDNLQIVTFISNGALIVKFESEFLLNDSCSILLSV